ncbi:MAG: GNAT family N-acetyltransferase [Myxococcales bacterium]|nr:GNAT family N-acetyltransferase [Myxococcales bacterium]
MSEGGLNDEVADSIVREAREEDLDAVSVLAARLVRMHHEWDRERFMRAGPSVEAGYRRFLAGELTQSASLVLVAVTPAGRIVGYAFGRLEPRNWEMLMDDSGVLHDVLVDDSARKGGIGAKLVLGFVERMRARGAQRIVLHTAAQNTAGQALFKKLGFRVTMLEMTL